MLLYKIIKEHDLHYGTLHRKFLRISIRTVSYTHLTLPTKLEV